MFSYIPTYLRKIVMQESYPIKDTFISIIDTLQTALNTDYVVGLLICTAFVAFFLGRMTK